MSIVKQQAMEVISALPDDCTFEDIQYHLYVREKVERGVRAIDEGRVVSQAEAEQRMKRWQPSSGQNVEAIRKFIASDSPAFADRVVDRLLESTRRLEKFPLSGHVVPEYGVESCREVISGVYRVIYVVREDVCYVVAVVHGSRDFKNAVDPSAWDVP